MQTIPIEEYILEKYKQQLVREQEPGGNKMTAKPSPSCCVVLCKRLGPHLFDIKKGIAVIQEEEENCLDKGDYMIMNPAKVIFMFE